MKAKKRFLYGLLTIGVASSIMGSGVVFAEGPQDPAPVIKAKVVNENSGKKVLFDNTHAQTAGAADWVIDGGFSDFGNALADNGFYVTELRKTTPITYSDLSGYDVLVIGEANIPYKQSEQDALLQYVQNGGSILFIGDHYNADRNKNRWDASEVFNGYRRGAWSDPAKGMSTEERNSEAMSGVVSSDWLGSNFGLRFRYNALGDITANNVVSQDQSFQITAGVSTFAMHAGSTLAILDPKKAKGIIYLPKTTVKWANAVDQGVYKGGGIDEGPFVAISKLGAGKAGFIGDSSPVEDATPKYLREETGTAKKTYDGFTEQDDATLLVNMVTWLSKQESYTSFDQVPGLSLSTVTPLLSIETPETSTEPQAEPWSAPQDGYKWWDASTFKKGSYGYSSIVQPPSNHSPVVAVPLADQSLTAGTGTTIDATGTFHDEDGDLLTISAASSNNSIVGASVSSETIALNPIAVGTANVTVTANDGNGGTVSDTFSVTVTEAGSVVLAEQFETGAKTAYSAGDVTLASGSWNFSNALLGNLSTDKKSGSQSARVKAPGSISMNFNVSNVKSVKISHANFGSDTGATWKLQVSTNSGSTWTDVSGTKSSSSSLVEETFTINQTGNVRIKIVVSGTSGARLNFDNISILN